MADYSDTESSGLMGGGKKKEPDWSRFGLSDEQQRAAEAADTPQHEDVDEVFEHHTGSEKNELFAEDQSAKGKPWYRSNFFISEPVLFGTWDGVFTSCMINIFGVVIFLRTGWMVGNAGIGFSTLIIFLTISVALVAALSAIGVCERCRMESGGVYFLLSHVLGARIGASVGILYCFGQAVACSLYVVGFGESIAALFHQDNVWISRGIAATVIFLLLGINVAGVKWVIRLQLVLLMVLFIAMLDFLVGSFVHTDEEHGFIGYDSVILRNNTGPSYLEGESFFTVFGVFFPTATGVFAGINMSGDLRQPSKNIPVGTLSAVGVSTLLYLAFAIVLGSTCMRDILQTDYMIAEKVSIVGLLFLAGLYISSISSCMGGLYGSPRILQCIATENVIPFIKVLAQGVCITKFCLFGIYELALSPALGCMSGMHKILHHIAVDNRTIPGLGCLSKTLCITKVCLIGIYELTLSPALAAMAGTDSVFHTIVLDKALPIPCASMFLYTRGPNKVPVFALIVITLISLVFIFIGQVNTLGPVVTMPFMLTYAAVDYAYFSLAMSYDRKSAREARLQAGGLQSKTGPSAAANGHAGVGQGQYGTIKKSTEDLDSLFPERVPPDQQQARQRTSSLGSPTFYTDPTGVGGPETTADTAELLKTKQQQDQPPEITRQPRSFYSMFCNRWLSLLGVVTCLVIMFAIQWVYALVTMVICAITYVYIGQASPGVFPGIADFSLIDWLREGVQSCCRRGPPPSEQIIVSPKTPALNTTAAQLTEDNQDFAERGRYHQSEVVKGENFDDPYDSE